jgi:dihydrofolate synthase/folylpolyglutamate synthase
MSGVDAVLARLAGLYPRSIDLSLDRVRAFLAKLGDPQARIAPVVHVAGTNGKGSTIATLRACLEAAGLRVHVYTSPHLVHFNERIRLAGRLIDDAVLLELLDEVERVNAGEPITVFEVTTAAAFLAFSRTPADIVLLETGLGGRLDATNVIERPAVTAITPVAMDHMAFLGNDIASIAGEKAGILKPGRPAVIGPQTAEAMAVIAAKAQALGAPLLRQGNEWRASPQGGGWGFSGRHWRLALPLPALPGRHQIDNAGIALACLEELASQGFALDPLALRQGMARIEWPARLQRLVHGPLAAGLPAGAALWLDGGHNPAAAEIIADFMRGRGDRPLHIVFGMLSNRSPAAFMAPLAGLAASVHTVIIPGEPNSHTAEASADILNGAGIAATAMPSVEDAVAAIRAESGVGAYDILICGSLYLAGQVLVENG